jgi:hypothetical protein
LYRKEGCVSEEEEEEEKEEGERYCDERAHVMSYHV